MNPWSKIASLCALALSVSVLAQAPEARAQIEIDNESVDEAESSLVTEPYHGGGCRSHCNNRFERCLDRAFGGRDDWRRGGRNHWGGRRGHAYQRCENQRDYCIASCRQGRGNDEHDGYDGHDW